MHRLSLSPWRCYGNCAISGWKKRRRFFDKAVSDYLFLNTGAPPPGYELVVMTRAVNNATGGGYKIEDIAEWDAERVHQVLSSAQALDAYLWMMGKR